jgi:hypothetical protein
MEELAQEPKAEWNGDPADYPWFQRSPELAAAIEMGNLDELLPDGTTVREYLGYHEYLEQMGYLKAMPAEVQRYRASFRQQNADSADAGLESAESETPSL